MLVGVFVGVSVGVGVLVGVSVGVSVGVPVGVAVFVGVLVGVSVGVEVGVHLLDGVDQVDQAFQGEVFALHGHHHAMGAAQAVQREHRHLQPLRLTIRSFDRLGRGLLVFEDIDLGHDDVGPVQGGDERRLDEDGARPAEWVEQRRLGIPARGHHQGCV